MIPHVLPIRYVLNARTDRARPYGPGPRAILNREAHERAFREISSWPGYTPTPLLELPGLARRLGVGCLWYKDESTRFGLGSFKALGGIYGVHCSMREGDSSQTFTCASVGNHGRAVARGAAMFGHRAVIFLPSRTPPKRIRAIRNLGAQVVMVDGTYDDAVEAASREAEAQGWIVVSDTAYPGYDNTPRHIMQGYTVMVREALAQLPAGSLPTHVFLQAGVGGLAAVVTAHLWETLSSQRPVSVVVEPGKADCLLESALATEPAPSRGTLSTSMECLACRHPSTLAWDILREGADAFLTVKDRAAEEAVWLLSLGLDGDPTVLTQPSGAAGLAGLMATLQEPSLASPLNLGAHSRVLLFGSEGPLSNNEEESS
jgi:diaminopropionate ammonia-lyase